MENLIQNQNIYPENKENKLLWLSFVLLALLFAPTIAWLFDRWTMGVWHNGHGILIAAVVMYLVWKELKNNDTLPQSITPWGFAALIPA
ncbi:MAG: hypothetical protein GQ581_09585, partial [Methyloprofundus sp.]|nr:hypothetical protein [Methyloprofundus sp.]